MESEIIGGLAQLHCLPPLGSKAGIDAVLPVFRWNSLSKYSTISWSICNSDSMGSLSKSRRGDAAGSLPRSGNEPSVLRCFQGIFKLCHSHMDHL
jgi:hypothetical protein